MSDPSKKRGSINTYKTKSKASKGSHRGSVIKETDSERNGSTNGNGNN